MAALTGAPFVWYRDGGPTASQFSGLTLAPGASCLVAHDDGAATLVRSWAFPEAK